MNNKVRFHKTTNNISLTNYSPFRVRARGEWQVKGEKGKGKRSAIQGD